MKIITLLLINGQEITGETESDLNDSEINLEYPIEIKETINQHGSISIFALPFMSYSDDKLFTFKEKHIITYTTPAKDVCEYYSKIKAFYIDQNTNLPEEDRDKIYRMFGNTKGNSLN